MCIPSIFSWQFLHSACPFHPLSPLPSTSTDDSAYACRGRHSVGSCVAPPIMPLLSVFSSALIVLWSFVSVLGAVLFIPPPLCVYQVGAHATLSTCLSISLIALFDMTRFRSHDVLEVLVHAATFLIEDHLIWQKLFWLLHSRLAHDQRPKSIAHQYWMFKFNLHYCAHHFLRFLAAQNISSLSSYRCCLAVCICFP